MTLEEAIRLAERAELSHDKMTFSKACDLLRARNDSKGKTLNVVIKISESDLMKWHNESRLSTSLHDETLFISDSCNKAFKSNMLGYSVFAQSLGSMKRHACEIDRIERLPIEWVYIDDHA